MVDTPNEPQDSTGATPRRAVFHWVLLIGLLGATTFAGYTAMGLVTAEVPTASADTTSGPRVNPFAKQDGLQLVAYVVAASDCGWSSTPAMMQIVGSIRDSLVVGLDPTYSSVRVVAVVLDDSVSAGWKFVSALSGGRPERSFDQVVLGGSWLNETLQRWIWRDSLVDAASPQVFLVARPIGAAAYLDDYRLRIGQDWIVARHVGSSSIHQWLAAGATVERPQAPRGP